jgi:hypothetical protein
MADPYDLRRIYPEESKGLEGGSPYRPFKPKKKPKPRYKQLELDLARIEKKRKSTQRVNEA